MLKKKKKKQKSTQTLVSSIQGNNQLAHDLHTFYQQHSDPEVREHVEQQKMASSVVFSVFLTCVNVFAELHGPMLSRNLSVYNNDPAVFCFAAFNHI